VIGGSYDISLDNEDVHPFGFKYNPLTQEWSTIKPMNFDRCRFSLNVLGDTLIAVGGHSEGFFQRPDDGNNEVNSNVATVERYDPIKDNWTVLKSMSEYRCQHAATTYKHLLFVSGGIDQYGGVLDTFYKYDSITDDWTKICHLTARADHILLRVDKKIYIAGGWQEEDGQRRLVAAIECYDIESSSTSVVTHIPTARYHAGITLIDEKIYVIGGFAADGN
jgi:N-acetylneuraminic acid mutarotase